MTQSISWQVKHFNELSLDQLYSLLKLRVDIFIVEQNCPYPDLDSEEHCLDRHPETRHLLGYVDNKLSAYVRILSRGQSYPAHISIGRVVTVSTLRGAGLGHQLMSKALSVCQQYFPAENIKISAQQHLKHYYQQHGFEQVSDMYLEDNIPHIAMIKEYD